MDNRNLNPHGPARVAMLIWGKEYSQQNGGCMDFWDALSDGRKLQAIEDYERVVSARPMREDEMPRAAEVDAAREPR